MWGWALTMLTVWKRHLPRAIWSREKLQRDMQNFDVGVRYEIYHALAMVLAGLLAWRAPSRWFQAAGLLFLIGTALFSGGLYYPVLTQTKLPWYLVPSGGMSLILAWLLLAAGALFSRPSEPMGRLTPTPHRARGGISSEYVARNLERCRKLFHRPSCAPRYGDHGCRGGKRSGGIAPDCRIAKFGQAADVAGADDRCTKRSGNWHAGGLQHNLAGPMLPSDGKIVTLESSEKHAQVARKNFELAGVSNVIELRMGRAVDSLAQVGCRAARSV